MFKVKVFINNEEKYGAYFENEMLANIFIENHLKANSWGRAERTVFYKKYEGRDPRAKVVAEMPNGKVECIIPADYEIVIEDIVGIDPPHILFERLRAERLILLAETDVTQLADYPLTSKEKGHMREYRAYLRGLPTQYSNDSIYEYKIKTYKEWYSWKHII